MQIATTHKNTDFDGLASILAATLLYPGCVAVCPKSVNPNVKRFLALHKTAFTVVLPKEIDMDQVDSLIIADTNQWSRLDRMEKLRDRQGVEILLWDHHMGLGDVNSQWQNVAQVGATITLFVQELQKQDIELTPLQSTVFLLGLYEDTGQLTFSSTTPADARVAAFLLEQGADLTIAVDFLNMAYGETQKKVLFRLLRDAEEIDIKGHHVSIGVVWVHKYTELAMVVQLYRKIVNADAVFGIFVNQDEKQAHDDGGNGQELAQNGNLAVGLVVMQIVGQHHHHSPGGNTDQVGEVGDIKPPGNIPAHPGDLQA